MRSLAAHPQVEVAALCDIDEETVADTGAAFSLSDERLFTRFEDFVNAPLDIVVVATPIEYHAQHSIAAMESGKHVLCEQTAAYTVADCERLVETVRKTGRVYMMGRTTATFITFVSGRTGSGRGSWARSSMRKVNTSTKLCGCSKTPRRVSASGATNVPRSGTALTA